MPNCTACKGAIEQEKDGNVCLPCGHTFHPICYLSSYNDNQDELPNDFIKLSKCVFCVLDATKIISDEPVDELFTDDDRQKYSMPGAMAQHVGNWSAWFIINGAKLLLKCNVLRNLQLRG